MLGHLDWFASVPEDWFVVVSDIRGSTEALNHGHYRDINILAASTVILGINAARAQDIQIPFIYGGDGATLLVPPELLSPLMRALETLRYSARKRFGLNLRIGALPLTHIREAGEDVRVARLRLASGYEQAVFLDAGLSYAERVIKDTYILQDHHKVRQRDLDLTGLECRWNEIAPPAGKEELFCLIVTATGPQDHFPVYQRVLEIIEKIYGNLEDRQPVDKQALSYTTDWRLIAHESYLRFGTSDWFYNIYHWFAAWYWRISGRSPEKQGHLVLATDHLKIDGALKTIIAGDAKMRRELINWLEQEEKNGVLRFGYHVTKAGTITCFVHQATSEYINFLDGSGGGYSQAAKMLKAKLK